MNAMGLEFPEDDDAFFNAMQCKKTVTPWYETRTSLPVGNDINVLKIDSARLQKNPSRNKCQCAHMECTAVDVGVYNERTEHATKSSLNFSIAMHHVNRILEKISNRAPSNND